MLSLMSEIDDSRLWKGFAQSCLRAARIDGVVRRLRLDPSLVGVLLARVQGVWPTGASLTRSHKVRKNHQIGATPEIFARYTSDPAFRKAFEAWFAARVYERARGSETGSEDGDA